MSSAVAAALASLPPLIAAHLLVSASAILLGIGIGVPLAIWAARQGRASAPVLALVATIQTVPALALLALFYPLLIVLGTMTGWPIPALGFAPALLALTLYALLPIVRNTIAALQGIDPAVIEAADGIGMTSAQKLRLVELPLALPVIVAGVRTASVWTIGAATLATTVGQSSLGNLIFSGLQTEDWTRVLVGCIASALLALAVDALFVLIESGIRRRARIRLIAGGLIMLIGLLAALAPLIATTGTQRNITIGAKNFTEQYILADLLAARARRAGYATTERTGLGSAVAYRALASGDIDAYVDYGGTLWANVLGRTDTPRRDVMLTRLVEELRRRDGVTLLGPLGFENAYAFVMRRDRAEELGIRTLTDLARAAPRLTFGTDLEFQARPEWRGVRDAYGLRFRSLTAFSPTFMYRAVADGTVDVISAFSSDGRLAALDLVTLGDPRGALPRYDAVLLLSRDSAGDERLTKALAPLIGAIDVETMRRANLMVDRDSDKRGPAEAARWLDAQIPVSPEDRRATPQPAQNASSMSARDSR